MTSPVVQRIKEFADLRWPDRDLPGRLRKLGEEIGELNEAAARLCSTFCYNGPFGTLEPNSQDEHDEYSNCRCMLALEIADVAIILQDILIITNCEGDLTEYMDVKMEENERREWPVHISDVVDDEQEGSE